GRPGSGTMEGHPSPWRTRPVARGPLGTVLGFLRRAAGAPAPGEPSDGRLLRQFAADRDEEAFAVLLQRHGPMVLDGCRPLLDQADAAEEAFQATFLVLARRALSVRKDESVASWLHGVALRVALRMRADAARRRARERQVVAVALAQADPAAEAARREL